MPNPNSTNCNCEGIWNETTSSCDMIPTGVNPCPTWFETASGWDWNNISNTALQWGWALGILNQPNQNNMDAQLYLAEIERQKKMTTYLIVGMVMVLLIVLIFALRKKK